MTVATRHRLLVVDADPVLRHIHQQELSRAGFEVVLAEDFPTACARLDEGGVDALVTELVLPGGSGAALCRRVAEQATRLPVVVLSPGHREIGGVGDALLRLPADQWLERPVSTDRLVWRLRELVRGRVAGKVDSRGEPIAQKAPFTLDPTVPFHQGDLKDRDPATLFFSFALGRRSGTLVVMNRGHVRQLGFIRGHPVYAESNVPGEDLGDFMVASRFLTPQALKEGKEEWQQVNRSLGVVLLSRGDLPASVLFRALREHLWKVTTSLFAWEEGEFYLEFAEDVRFPERVPINCAPEQFVLDGIRKGYSHSRVEKLMASVKGRLTPSPDAHFIVRELSEPAHLENVLSCFTPPKTLEETMKRSGFTPATARDALGLRIMGALWEEGTPASPRPSLKEEAAPSPLPPPGSHRREVIDIEAHSLSTPPLRRVPVAPPAPPSGEEGPPRRLGAIPSAVTRPPRRPGDEAQRESRRAHLMGALEGASASVHFDNGMAHLLAGKGAEAVVELEKAVGFSPLNASFHEALGRAWLVADSSATGARAGANSLGKAVALDPSRGTAHHFLGASLFRLGRFEAAAESLQRSITLGGPHARESQSLLEKLKK